MVLSPSSKSARLVLVHGVLANLFGSSIGSWIARLVACGKEVRLRMGVRQRLFINEGLVFWVLLNPATVKDCKMRCCIITL